MFDGPFPPPYTAWEATAVSRTPDGHHTSYSNACSLLLSLVLQESRFKGHPPTHRPRLGRPSLCLCESRDVRFPMVLVPPPHHRWPRFRRKTVGSSFSVPSRPVPPLIWASRASVNSSKNFLRGSRLPPLLLPTDYIVNRPLFTAMRPPNLHQIGSIDL